MLAVQYNPVSDQVFEAELRKARGNLSYRNLCTQLEKYLQRQQWREADEETAFIFYQVMVLAELENVRKLLRKFPSETLNQIDELWVTYSNGYFGFSVQKALLKSLEAKSEYDQKTWDEFLKTVGWYPPWENWWNDNNLKFTLEELKKGNLPWKFTWRRRKYFTQQNEYFLISCQDLSIKT